MFARLQAEQLLAIKIEAVSLDSTSIEVHPDGTGAQIIGCSPGRRTTKLHLVAAPERCALKLRLTPGQ